MASRSKSFPNYKLVGDGKMIPPPHHRIALGKIYPQDFLKHTKYKFVTRCPLNEATMIAVSGAERGEVVHCYYLTENPTFIVN